MKLISIQEHSDYLHSQALMSMSERWNLHRKRVEFGRQKLELWMFIPCKLVEGVWVILEEPNHLDYKTKNSWNELVFKSDFACNNYHQAYDEYQEAKDRVLFEGFEYKNEHGLISVINNKTNIILFLDSKFKVEQLAFGKVCLTPTAQKQIGF